MNKYFVLPPVLAFIILLTASALFNGCASGYEVKSLDVEHKGVKVKHNEQGTCIDGTAVGEGKACIDLKKKEDK
jgi:hypothetical protein